MPIVASTFVLDASAQVDGRRWCTETHTDELGVTYPFAYLSAQGMDNTAIMNARAVQLAADLAQAEFEAALGS